MSEIDDLVPELFEESLDYIGEPFIFRGVEIMGIPGELSATADPQEYGMSNNMDMTVTFTRSTLAQFGDPESMEGQIIKRKKNGVTYVIGSPVIDNGGNLIDINLQGKAQS